MTNVITIYHYNKEGKITATGQFDKDIFDVVPPNSTLEQPPKDQSELENEVLRFDADNEEWNLIADYRNNTYIDSEGKTHTIEELGVEPKDDWELYKEETRKSRLNEVENALTEIYTLINN